MTIKTSTDDGSQGFDSDLLIVWRLSFLNELFHYASWGWRAVSSEFEQATNTGVILSTISQEPVVDEVKKVSQPFGITSTFIRASVGVDFQQRP